MSGPTEDLESKLLAILNEPEESESLVETIEKTADGEATDLTEDQRATLQTLLEAGLPTPEEIVADAERAEHNAQIKAAREADLARRRERRARLGKNKKHRRR